MVMEIDNEFNHFIPDAALALTDGVKPVSFRNRVSMVPKLPMAQALIELGAAGLLTGKSGQFWSSDNAHETILHYPVPTLPHLQQPSAGRY